MTTYTMVHGSTEFRRVLVSALDDDGVATDPTGYDVEIAFMPVGSLPEEDDWNAATWVTSGSRYYARILVGPDGGLHLADTDHHVYIRIDAGMEYPTMLAGTLVFM